MTGLHEHFFKVITINKLNELLHRITTQYFDNQINSLLNEKQIPIYIFSEITKKCDIIINFYNMQNDTKEAHITFHLQPNSSNSRLGRFHIRNNRNNQRSKVFRINISNPNIFINIPKHPLTRQLLDDAINTAKETLNDYFNSKSDYHLRFKLTKELQNTHKCIPDIIYKMKNSKTPLKHTKKQFNH